MSSYKLGILGPFSGKTGPVVGSSWKGKPVMRAMPAVHTDAKTPAQLTQRLKFSLIQKFLSHARDFINVGFADFKAGTTARNAALSYNLNAAVVGEYPDIHIDYEAVMLSRGRLRGAKNVGVSQEADEDIVISWDALSGKTNANNSDNIMVMMYNEELDEGEVILDAGIREELTLSVTPFGDYAGQAIHIWIAFQNEAKTMLSDSLYVGEHVVL